MFEALSQPVHLIWWQLIGVLLVATVIMAAAGALAGYSFGYGQATAEHQAIVRQPWLRSIKGGKLRS